MSRRIAYVFRMSLLFLFCRAPLSAQETELLPFDITAYRLDNGLQIILAEDYNLPLVSVVVAYNVGSLNEHPQKTGLAYMLENLMFQGSRNIGPMQHIHFISKIGGVMNAVTTEERTMFYQTVPANQLALVLWLESDRMISLDINASKVKRTRDSLIEEIRQRKIDDPYFESSLLFDQLLYPNKTYSHPVIGSESDLREFTDEDVQDFYATYYVPNNAVLCITGNFEKRKAIALVRKYFSTIPPGNPIPPFPSAEHLKLNEIVQDVENYLAPSPGYHLGYRIPSSHSPDFYALGIIETILLQGKSARLYKRLIQEERVASHLSGSIEQRKNLAAFKVFVRNPTETLRDRSQKAIFNEIDDLKSGFISENELNKAKNIFKMNYLDKLSLLVDRGVYLAEFYLSQKNIDAFAQELDKYMAVSPSDIIGIMNRYFTEERVVLNIKTK
jgi:zinc protease